MNHTVDQRKLEAKVIVVTGAAKGIGRAIALRCADEGAAVVLVDRDETQLSAVMDDIQARIGEKNVARFSSISGDISEESTIRTMIDTALEGHGRLDGLVNNAGIFGAYNRFENNSVELFEQMIAINVRPAWQAMQYAKAAMLESEGGGAIVNISSMAAMRANRGLSTLWNDKRRAG